MTYQIVPDQESSHLPISVLLAEDDRVTRHIMVKNLENAGYRVVSVSDGNAALEKLKETHFAFLVTDWSMPGKSGPDLCRAVREMRSESYIYILIVTARQATGDVIWGLDAGADDFLCKPVDKDELLARMSTGKRILALEQRLKIAYNQIEALSQTDALTGAYNRRYLMSQLPKEIQRAHRYGHSLSLILSDIDFFKKVNDNFGHQVGDLVLKNFAKQISDSLRDRVDWLARYGGEEFLVVLPETPYKKALVMAERMRRVIGAKAIACHEGKDVFITCSFGVTGLNSTEHEKVLDADTLVSTADTYLYKCKKAGRNRVMGGLILPKSVPGSP